MSDAEKLRQSIEQMRQMLPLLIQNVSVTAQITKAKYEALRKEGFTESQAIELCRTGSAIL